MKILAFDTETGGLNPKDSSLLTAYFAILDSNLKTLDSISLVLKPEDGLFKANPEALAVNKINLEEHALQAITYEEAASQLEKMLAKHSSKYDKLVPLAHNIEFDLGFVYEYLLSQKAWESYVQYRKLDTAQIANFLKFAGLIPNSQKVALGYLAKFLGLSFGEGGAHSAQADVDVCVQVLGAFKKLLNGNVEQPKAETPSNSRFGRRS